MTDPAAPAPPTETSDADDRGSLDVRVRAVQHIIEAIALDVPGSIAHSTALDKVRRAGAPSARVALQRGSARVHVDVAAVWPAALSDIATQVRDAVLSEAPRLSGVHIRSCDVTIRTVGAAEADQPERKVQ